jgi:LDH2 family malate/lactate/ureidoglycolate dehydrogenase
VVEILMPGERGARALAARTRDGIPLPPPIVEELRGVATRFGLATFPSAL